MLFRSSTLQAGLLLVSLPVTLATPHFDDHAHAPSVPPNGNGDGQLNEISVDSGPRDQHYEGVIKYDGLYSNGQGQDQKQDEGRGGIQTTNSESPDSTHPNDLSRSMGVVISTLWQGNIDTLGKSQGSDADTGKMESDHGAEHHVHDAGERKIVPHRRQPEDEERDEAGHITKRENTKRGSQDFHVKQVRNAEFVPSNGLQQMLKAYNKFGKPLPERLKKAIRENPKAVEQSWASSSTLQARDNNDLQARAVAVVRQKAKKKLKSKAKPVQRFTQATSGTVPAVQPLGIDFEYNCPVKIGTPPQTMNLNLDTGSADLWVFSTDTPVDQLTNQQRYNPKVSTTSSLQAGKTWSIKYGDGSGASGVVYQDVVSVGGIVFQTQMVESAQQVSKSFTANSHSSGLIGLAQSKGNTIAGGGALTFMDNVKAGLSLPLFTANLRHKHPGNYNFGYINASEYTGAITYAPIDPASVYWQISVSGYQIGSDPFNATSFNAIADTGTTLLLLPRDIVRNYYRNVQGSFFCTLWGAMLFPCASAIPDFWFGVGSYRGFIPGKYIKYGQTNATHCYGGLQSSNGIGLNVLGDILLKAQFVVFDYRNGGRVGFASKPL